MGIRATLKLFKTETVKKFPKTVIFVIDNFEYGGSTSFIDSYTRYLNGRGYNIIIIGEEGKALQQKEYFRRCKIISLPKGKWEAEHSKNLFYTLIYRLHYFYKFNVAFRKVVIDERPDAIHLNLTWSSLAILLFNPLVYRLPRVITFYGDRALEIESINKYLAEGGILRFKIELIRILQGLTFTLSTKVIAFSSYSRDLLISRFGVPSSKIEIIPGVIFKKDYLGIKKKRVSASKEIKILNISRFENRKGHDLLLRAMKVLLNKGLKVNLTLCGSMDGGVLEILRLYEKLDLKKNLNFLHGYHGREKLLLIRDADLFVIPSKELETFGMTIIEALAIGTPVIGTPVGAIPEILSKVDKKLISDSISAVSLARAITHFSFLSFRKKRQLAYKSRVVAFKYYNADVILRKLESLYSL